jgi:CBS domain-containing protein
MGFSPSSAGGLIGMDFVAVRATAAVRDAIGTVAASASLQPEALTSVHAVDERGHLCGVAKLVTLVQADPAARLSDIYDDDPVRVGAGTGTGMVDVAVLMSDYNLITIPVVDEQRTMIGIITVDDVLEVSASVFLLLLCNDPEVLGPRVNQRGLYILASIIIGVLLTLSGTLVVSTVFPALNVTRDRDSARHRTPRGRGRGWPVAGDHPAPRGPGPAGADDGGGSHELADAPARPAQAGGLVTRDEAGRAPAPRLPRDLGHPAHRQSGTTRRRLTGSEQDLECPT